MRTLMLLGVVLFGLAAPLAARDVFVNNVQGSPNYDGLNPEAGLVSGPFRSITHALKMAQKGDRIVLANTGVPYTECITLQTEQHCGGALGPFTILGNGAILDGSRPIPREFWKHYLGTIFELPLRKRGPYQMLFLDGKPLPRVDFSADKAAELPPMHWGYYNGSMYLRIEKGTLIDDYNLSLAWHDVGVTLYHVHDVIIADLTIQGFLLDGVNVNDKVDRCLLGGLTCRGNGRSGITVAGSSRCIIEECLLGNNGAAQLRVEGESTVDVVNSTLIPSSVPRVIHTGGQLNIEPPLEDEAEAEDEANNEQQ